jgi:transposase
MPRPARFSPEVRARAVRMVVEHEAAHESQWAAITSIAEKIGCTAETLRKWVRQAERDQGTRPGLTTEERQRLKQLERENFELRRANEILKKASAYFAQAELGLPSANIEEVLQPWAYQEGHERAQEARSCSDQGGQQSVRHEPDGIRWQQSVAMILRGFQARDWEWAVAAES